MHSDILPDVLPDMLPDILPDILLCTLNAKYSHASMGLRCLYANMGNLQQRTRICEYTINEDVHVIAEKIIEQQPRIIACGVYIWNVEETHRVLSIVRTVLPDVCIIGGGPEISFENVHTGLRQSLDCIITGEADCRFAEVCRDHLAGRALDSVIAGGTPDLAKIQLPYKWYSDEDLAHRIIYVEASRGCPFTCEFCLSSLDQAVRNVPLDDFLLAMKGLLDRGCRVYKFVDRTFNLSPRIASAIMNFFLDNWLEGLFLHFEMVPDRLPQIVKDLLPRFPKGAVQFEIGIQSFTAIVAENMSRRKDTQKTIENFQFLKAHTGVHIHADLIIGLPGETFETMAHSFDQLWFIDPDDVQVGILKLLKGTPLKRHIGPYAMKFSDAPPYEILESADFPYMLMQRLKRFARYIEMFINSTRFCRAVELIIQADGGKPFAALFALSDWLWAETAQEYGISMKRQYELMGRYLGECLHQESALVCAIMAEDFLDSRHNPMASPKGLPDFMRQDVDRLRSLRKRAALEN